MLCDFVTVMRVRSVLCNQGHNLKLDTRRIQFIEFFRFWNMSLLIIFLHQNLCDLSVKYVICPHFAAFSYLLKVILHWSFRCVKYIKLHIAGSLWKYENLSCFSGMWHFVAQYIIISISCEVLCGRRIEAGCKKFLWNVLTTSLEYTVYHPSQEWDHHLRCYENLRPLIWRILLYVALVLHLCCVPEKVGENNKGVNKNDIPIINNGIGRVEG